MFPCFYISLNVCKRSSGWIRYDNHIHITQPSAKYMYLIAYIYFALGWLCYMNMIIVLHILPVLQ